jgi:hypothetical protein
MSETVDYFKTFAQFPLALRRFLQTSLTLAEAQNIIHERMAHREENFLRIVERSIFNYPRSPYLPLMKMAGCDFSDLRALVNQKGLEGALRELREEGVYVTYEELKGRKPITRGRLTLPVTPRDFDNPFARRDFTAESSGSTGLATKVNQDLDSLADATPALLLSLKVHHASDAPIGQWSPFLPGPGFRGVFQLARAGKPLLKWFAPGGWRDSKYWMRYALATLYMNFWMRRLGYRVPSPEIVRPERAIVVARWIAETLRTSGACVLITGVSRAMRVCLAAEQAGLDLTGAVFRVGGEPLTPAKADAIRRVGARLISVYSMTESGHPLALDCANSTDVSDMHVAKDALALITHDYAVPSAGITVPAINLTSLLDTAPKLLLNAQIDDYGVVEERSCGCEYETYGYSTHLSDVRSYSKLVSEGATLMGNDMVRILEQVLPARFGGSPLDYQILEEEDERGFTVLDLVISPRVDIADERKVIEVVLDGLSRSSPMADAARTVWQNAASIRIKRQEPVWTVSGKLLPLHLQQRSKTQTT